MNCALVREEGVIAARQSVSWPRFGLAFQNIVYQETAHLIARNGVDVEQLDRALVWLHRPKIDGKASSDHAVGLKQNEIEFQHVIGRAALVRDHDVGTAAVLRGLKLVEFDREAGFSTNSAAKDEQDRNGRNCC